MQVRVGKWGDSLAVRIPEIVVQEVHLEEDALVKVSVVDGKLMVEPVGVEHPTLEQLLAGITEQNLHGEVDTGAAMGHEAW
ncbi:MAG TPA: AbrB/MazE/SpoVT family DNA-binding domain-containing protein [Ardenticatenaceae bacterium]|jgi:antitoxin MazE